MRIRSLLWWTLFALSVPMISACNPKEDSAEKDADGDDDDDDKKKKKKKKSSDDDDDKEEDDDDKEEDDDDKEEDDDDGDPPTPPSDFNPKLATGRSLLPTLAEWDAQREVTVKGSSALNCETKMVREYLRVSCRGQNDTGGTPTTVRVVRGGAEAMLYAAGNITSLVIPFIEGINAEVLFSWTDKAHPLTLVWPRGAPQPQVIGVFEGAKSPLDGTDDSALMAKLCQCHKQVTKQSTCEMMFAWANPDCERTYSHDCQRLLECSRGEPSAIPACQSGYLNAGTGHMCLKPCGRSGSCPGGQECISGIAEKPVCMDG